MVIGISFENIDLKRKLAIIIIITGRLLYRFTQRKGGNIIHAFIQGTTSTRVRL